MCNFLNFKHKHKNLIFSHGSCLFLLIFKLLPTPIQFYTQLCAGNKYRENEWIGFKSTLGAPTPTPHFPSHPLQRGCVPAPVFLYPSWKEGSPGCCPYASLLFDNCATLNHSIRVQDQAQTQAQLESSTRRCLLAHGPRCLVLFCPRVLVSLCGVHLGKYFHMPSLPQTTRPKSQRFRSSKPQQQLK